MIVTCLFPSTTLAADWSSWWLLPNYSIHGRSVDRLFLWIFWITIVVMVLVQGAIVVLMVRYRHRAGRKARYIHGNTRLEVLWTIIPAAILGVLTFSSKQVWTAIRYAPESRPPTIRPAKILVIGQMFKWNIIYPGADGEFGQYLVYAKPTDQWWPDRKRHGGVNGPRDLPADQVEFEIERYNTIENPLGKVYDDPRGKDDDYEDALARAMEVPVNRPVDVYLTSKDVIHSFTLPNFRVKLDTVPGLMGVFTFTPTMMSEQLGPPGYFEIACQELCGQGHFTMQGRMVVISQEQYAAKHEMRGGKADP
ncbi:MAG: cytochrome c oxidase subunit II [Phycisphaerales bacterium]|nr:cytochrome c oxidase subunit II [Phycisphaerales bacterium]